MDPHANFAYSTVATAPSPTLSGTSLVVAAGQGALFPAPPFNAVVWPATSPLPLAANAEIVRVTGVSTDTFTIVRGPQTANDPGGINAPIAVGWQIMESITRKTLTNIEASLAQTPLAGLTQSGNTGVSARSNVGYLGLAAHTDGAIAATGVCCAVPVPVAQGDVITTVSYPVGATVNSSPTHQFAAIYSGIATTPALVGQSTDTGTAVIAQNALLSYTLAAPITITTAMAPYGYVYASLAITATTLPSALGVTLLATAAEYPWFAHSPLFFCMTHGSAVGGTAPSTIASASAKAFCPYVILN